jgi:hypothetical protein
MCVMERVACLMKPPPHACVCAHTRVYVEARRARLFFTHTRTNVLTFAAYGETQSKSATSNQASVRHNNNNNKKRITCSLFSHLRAAVNASKQFKYADNASLNLSRCAHESEGPPPQNRKEGERRGRKGERCREKHTGMAKVSGRARVSGREFWEAHGVFASLRTRGQRGHKQLASEEANTTPAHTQRRHLLVRILHFLRLLVQVCGLFGYFDRLVPPVYRRHGCGSAKLCPTRRHMVSKISTAAPDPDERAALRGARGRSNNTRACADMYIHALHICVYGVCLCANHSPKPIYLVCKRSVLSQGGPVP